MDMKRTVDDQVIFEKNTIKALEAQIANATSTNKPLAIRRELAANGAGIAGGIAGGALAGLACGPGAPVCVTVGAFVGGAMAAFGTSYIW